ncbi:MarR family transcriptional regulator [Sporosarcina sp. BI001-red]|uniref:MarR family winged helix-turn-helix transcriptional regulator n=1 Tax=Sporosarcina sp. BI001-red TaxID=2282866 RepID=UPI000E23C87A|nr:MarR family winged helix-turn-helix transcriptional regulator [Sporosarcina sp. BI001-red]REB08716.1 MarR family transcriptional regulator [Sporosarcina sp. BI001-red]
MKNAYSSPILNSFSSINQALFQLSKEDAERNGLTVPQLKALYRVSSKPDQGLVELAESLKLTNSTVSGIVDRLVKNGLLKRHHQEGDRRAVVINLTEEGERKLEDIIQHGSHLVDKLAEIEQLPKEELEQLFHLHSRILNLLTSQSSTGGMEQ